MKSAPSKISKQSKSKPAVKAISDKPPEPTAAAQSDRCQQLKEARNKANTRKNAASVDQYLMHIEKVHGFAKSWALRERLEQGQVTLDELKRGLSPSR